MSQCPVTTGSLSQPKVRLIRKYVVARQLPRSGKRNVQGRLSDEMVRRELSNANRQRPKRLEGRYANYFEVGHNSCEFIFDFGQYHPENEDAHMHTRIVTGPVYAKLLAELLKAAVDRFESANGSIQPAEDDFDPVELVKQSIAGYEMPFQQSRAVKRDANNGPSSTSGYQGDPNA